MNRTFSPAVQVVATAIGAALFFVLGRFAAIPTPVPNSTISLQYALLAVFAVIFGPVVGALAGGIGHVLIDATGYGIWISWELASVVVGLIIGAIMLHNHFNEGETRGRDLLRFNIAVIVANAVAFLLFAPIGDILIYKEPANKVFAQGAMAFVSDSLTACILGSIILLAYARSRTKTGALKLEQD